MIITYADVVEYLNQIRVAHGVPLTDNLRVNSQGKFHQENYLKELTSIEDNLKLQQEGIDRMRAFISGIAYYKEVKYDYE